MLKLLLDAVHIQAFRLLAKWEYACGLKKDNYEHSFAGKNEIETIEIYTSKFRIASEAEPAKKWADHVETVFATRGQPMWSNKEKTKHDLKHEMRDAFNSYKQSISNHVLVQTASNSVSNNNKHNNNNNNNNSHHNNNNNGGFFNKRRRTRSGN